MGLSHRQRINRERAARIVRKRRRVEADRFATVLRRGSVVYCDPATFAAIQTQSEPVATVGGVEIRSSRFVPPGTLYAVQRTLDLPPFTRFMYRPLW